MALQMLTDMIIQCVSMIQSSVSINFFADAAVKPEHVNEYLTSVSSAEISSRKRITELISRPQTDIHSLFNLVPRGTFNKFNISLDEEFSSPLNALLAPDTKYSDLVQYSRYQDLDKHFSSDYSGSLSYKDAAYVLQYNCEYPVSKLDQESLDGTVNNNYKREILDSSEIAIKYKG